MKRINKLRNAMTFSEMDCVLISSKENYFYLSGFTGSYAILCITKSKQYLLTDFRYVSQAKIESPNFEIIEVQGNSKENLKEIMIQNSCKIIGFEEDFITFEKYLDYRNNFVEQSLMPLNSMVNRLRLIKDEDELENIKTAVKIADEAFTHILKYIKPGVTELDIAAEIEHFMKKNGASNTSFETIVASGKRSSLPHGVASKKKIELHDVVTLDFGCIYNNYCSDITRTIFVGKNNEMQKIYNIVLEAQIQSTNKAITGEKCNIVDEIARNIIDGYGYGKNFGHGLGHGVGIEVHEDPRFSKSCFTILENNMVLTVEPGIYLNDIGGVRIEDIIVICDDKPTILTKSTKEIIEI